jgi:hypothetical protein
LLWIRDIFVRIRMRIRILGAIPLTNGSRCGGPKIFGSLIFTLPVLPVYRYYLCKNPSRTSLRESGLLCLGRTVVDGCWPMGQPMLMSTKSHSTVSSRSWATLAIWGGLQPHTCTPKKSCEQTKQKNNYRIKNKNCSHLNSSFEFRISSRIFEKIRNGATGIFGGSVARWFMTKT